MATTTPRRAQHPQATVEQAQQSATTDPSDEDSQQEPVQPQGRRAYPGQLTEAELRTLLETNRALAEKNRADFLKANADRFQPCAVSGCAGLARKDFVRTTVAPDGTATTYGFCPRRAVHARLFPALMGQPTRR